MDWMASAAILEARDFGLGQSRQIVVDKVRIQTGVLGPLFQPFGDRVRYR